jgi:hypothetical protein
MSGARPALVAWRLWGCFVAQWLNEWIERCAILIVLERISQPIRQASKARAWRSQSGDFKKQVQAFESPGRIERARSKKPRLWPGLFERMK